MILTHHGIDSMALFVTIGGRKYPIRKIGGLWWIQENLDYIFDGCTTGSKTENQQPKAFYFDDDEAKYGIDGDRKCGAMYNWYAVKYLEDNKASLLPSGWRVANNADWQNLMNVYNNDATSLKIKDDTLDGGTWPTGWNGTDNTHFAIVPGGSYVPPTFSGSVQNYQFLNDYTHYWTINNSSSVDAYRNYFQRDGQYHLGIKNKEFGFYVRLVKD